MSVSGILVCHRAERSGAAICYALKLK